jgi:organic radical activating enzyme
MSRPFSHTSNTVKLYKHLDNLKKIQSGVAAPIMVHFSPTNKCQMHCAYCCFKNREDKTLELPFEHIVEGFRQFYELGVRAVEITGGGSPTLYSKINELILFLKSLDMHLGMNTNAVDADRVNCWECFDWVRISFNAFDFYDHINIAPIRKAKAYISGCYIWNELSTIETFKKVIDCANKYQIVCRIAPDCIRPLKEIDELVEQLRAMLRIYAGDSEYVFLSDFNIDTYRHNYKCFIHLIKPLFFTDGYVYPCPSMELAYEHNYALNKEYRLCRFSDILDFYHHRAFDIPERTCSYCKYAKQQIILEEVLTETRFNEFA